MKPPAFSYHTPATLAEAITLVSTLENARVLSGGQSLMPMLNMRYVLPDHVIDIGRLGELAYIREAAGHIEIGGMTRQREIEYSDLIAARLPLMNEAIQWVGHRQTRNRGTIGGSLCHLDPAAEMVATLVAFDGTMIAQGPGGVREIPASEWTLGYMTPALNFNEMLIGVRITPWPDGHGAAFVEFARRHGDFAIASAAAMLTVDGAGRIDRAVLTIGGVGPAPVRVSEAEQALIGQVGSEALFAQVAKFAAGIEAIGDALVPAEYRAHLAGVMAKRALGKAWARIETAGKLAA